VSLVRSARGDSLFLFGDSARAGAAPAAPADLASVARPVVERALAAGRPLVVITDGEVDDADALAALPRGSRVDVVPRATAPDAALLSLEAPRAAVSGDTIDVRVAVVAGNGGSAAGRLTLYVGDRRVADEPVPELAPFAEGVVSLRASAGAGEGSTTLRAVLGVPGDREPRNDTLAAPLDLSRAAAAVFVSTSPDYDARYVLSVLRGALSLPARGYFRVAPGAWRADGSLAPVSEDEVRRAFAGAPIAILHGDTLIFGPPRRATRGSLALLAPPAADQGDWYPVAAPPSPVAAALASISWDSLPPLDVSASLPTGDWGALEAARGRRFERRIAIAGSERPRRVVVVGASGFWRWQFRGGVAADAFAALWGSLFDWLAAERRDLRSAVPADGLVRAGEPIRWRRGGDDTVVAVTLSRRGPPRESAPPSADSMTIAFPAGANVAETPALPAGTYDARMPGGSAVLVVNASREWLPRAATVRSGDVGRAATAGDAPRLRSFAWPFVLVVLALCAEWVLRRRIGLR
jgi:hypothetical protein